MKKLEGGGGGRGDPLVGTPRRYGTWAGVVVGTVTGVHTRKSGVVWVRYPNNPNLYEVERRLIFGTAEAAEAHLQKVRKGKTPHPPNEASQPPTNPQENPEPNPNTPTNLPNPPSETQATPALWDASTSFLEV